MAPKSASTSSQIAQSSEKADKKAQEKRIQEEKNAAKRRHDYVPANQQPKGRLLRIHTQEEITHSMPGRIIKEWVECKKPISEPNRGCRTGRMGFWVETEDGYKAVLICKRKTCDWQADGEVDGEEHQMEDEEGGDESLA